MNRYIDHIKLEIRGTSYEIDLKGKNLILIGKNGSGKTQLLNALHDILQSKIVNRINRSAEQIDREIESYQRSSENSPPSDQHHEFYKQKLIQLQHERRMLQLNEIVFSDIDDFVVRVAEKSSLCTKYDATRQADIRKSETISSKDRLKASAHQMGQAPNASSLFEEYLTNQKTLLAFAESQSVDNDPQRAAAIKSLFNKILNDFKFLFEDDSIELIFESESLSFFIKQANKDPFQFQRLSSGFSSILAVYADLITRIELNDMAAEDINGVVIIDEIDAHLHVSLQRKIFAFLTHAFPNIQFIVSTHSPFVISSVNNALIYDVGKQEQTNDSLSLYSYSSIMEGIFDTATSSIELDEKIKNLCSLLEKEHRNLDEISAITKELAKHKGQVDIKSRAFITLAENFIAENEK